MAPPTAAVNQSQFEIEPPDQPTKFEIESPGQPKPEGAVSRFLTRATGLPISDIAAHPGAYLNPFSSESTPTRDAFIDTSQHPERISNKTPTQMIPGYQTYRDIKDKNYAGAAGDVLPPALAFAGMASGFRGPHVNPPEILPPEVPPRLTGDVMPSHPPSAPPSPYRYGPGSVTPETVGTPSAPNFVLRKGLLSDGAMAIPTEPAPAPYRYGPGSIVSDIVGTPNSRVLAGNQGIRTTPRGLLNPPIEDFEGPSPPKNPFSSYRDNFEDAQVRDRMQEDLDRQERAGRGQESREFADRNSMDKPKWLRQVEAGNQQRLDAAQAKAQRPVRYTETPPAKTADFIKTRTEQPSITNPNDLESTLRKSIIQSNAAKAEPVRVDYDQNGNVVDADGRHRVIEAMQRGDQFIEVRAKLADGSVQILKVRPADVARKMGVTPGSLKVTDEQQAPFINLKIRRR